MEAYVNTITDTRGNSIPNAVIAVYADPAGGGVYDAGMALVTLYSDNGVTVKANPFASDVHGRVKFFAANAALIMRITHPNFNGGVALDVPIVLNDLMDDVEAIALQATANLAASYTQDGFPTKALMDAAAGSYTEGKVVFVTNDPTVANNGLWIKGASVFTQSSTELPVFSKSVAQDFIANRAFVETFATLDLNTQTAVNLTDAASPTVTKTKVATGLQLALTTTSRTFVFSTANKTGAGKTRLRYRAQCTFATTCHCGFTLTDGVGRATFQVQQVGWLVYTNTRGGGATLSTSLGAFTTGAVVEMEAIVDALTGGVTLFVSINGAAPFAFSVANNPVGNIELLQRGNSTVIHGLQIEAQGAYDLAVIDSHNSAAPALFDQNALAAAAGLLKTLRRQVPAGWTYAIPTGLQFFQSAGAYFSSIDLQPLLSEADPEVLVIYVDIATGSNSNAGTAAAPLKSLNTAAARIGAGAKAIIKAKGGLYSYADAFGGGIGGSIVQIVSWDGVPVISSRHDTGLTWVLDSDNTYTAAFTAGISTVFDAGILTTDGDYSALNLAASLVTCKATPGTYFISGSNVSIHLADNRAPDSDVRVYKQAASGTADNAGVSLTVNNQTVYLQDIYFEGGASPVITAAGVNTHRLTIYARDCTFKYAGGNGLSIASAGLYVMQNCIAAWNGDDGFNYKGSAFGGVGPLAIEIDCIGRWNGRDAEGTNNGSTMHSSGSMVRVNGDYHHNQNRNIHDIDNCFSWNMGSIARDSQGPSNSVNFAVGVGAADASLMWLDGCVSSGSDTDLQENGLSTIYTFNLTSEGVTAGTITPYVP